MPQLQDPNFWHSVILIIEQNRAGAYGFVINRPSEIPLAAVLKCESTRKSAARIPTHIPTWNGGPIGTDNGLILTDQIYPGSCEEDVIGDRILLTSEKSALDHLIEFSETHHPDELTASRYPFRFLIGYAGWGPGQLEEELRQGSWLQIEFNHTLVFDTPFGMIWDQAIASLGVSPNELTAPAPSNFLN